jgi:hypothetical protein
MAKSQAGGAVSALTRAVYGSRYGPTRLEAVGGQMNYLRVRGNEIVLESFRERARDPGLSGH